MKKQTVLIFALLNLSISALALPERNPAEVSPTPVPSVSAGVTNSGFLTNLRSRARFLSFVFEQKDETVDTTIGLVAQSMRLRGQEISTEFGHNYGLAQTSVFVNRSIKATDDGTSQLYLENVIYGLGIRYNFIENSPGNDLIPYVKAKIGILSVRRDDSINKPMNLFGSENALSLGLEWLPFSEIFAVNFQIYQVKAKAKTTYMGTPVEINKDSSGGSVGFNLYF